MCQGAFCTEQQPSLLADCLQSQSFSCWTFSESYSPSSLESRVQQYLLLSENFMIIDSSLLVSRTLHFTFYKTMSGFTTKHRAVTSVNHKIVFDECPEFNVWLIFR